MEEQRNTECWYRETCQDNCSGCATYIQMKYQMDNSGLPKVKQQPIVMYISDENKVDELAYKRLSTIRNNIENFVDEGRNLYICSDTAGNGKTSWAIRMLHTYFHYRAEGNFDNPLGMYVSVIELLLRLKDFNNPLPLWYKQRLETVDLVVFDDIALTDISQYDFMQLYSIINNRVFAGKSNIFTSNVVDYKRLEKILGTRLASRVYNPSEIIELKGMDMR